MDTTKRSLGQCVILEEIGSGGMATVFRGIQQSIGRDVAVKVLRRSLVDQDETFGRGRQKDHPAAQAARQAEARNVRRPSKDFAPIAATSSQLIPDMASPIGNDHGVYSKRIECWPGGTRTAR